MNKTLAIVSLLGCVTFGGTMGCSGSPDSGEVVAQSVDQGLVSVLPAGKGSRSLGIDHWALTKGTRSMTMNAMDPRQASVLKIRLTSRLDPGTGLRHFTLKTPEGRLTLTEKGDVLKNTLSVASVAALQNLKADVEHYKATGEVPYSCAGDTIILVGSVLAAAFACAAAPIDLPVCAATAVVALGAYANFQDSCGGGQTPPPGPPPPAPPEDGDQDEEDT